MDRAQSVGVLLARGSASQESRKQAKVWSLKVKTQGASQQEAGESQINVGRCDYHVDRVASGLGGSGRIPSIRLQ
jgi:hypothetical protein